MQDCSEPNIGTVLRLPVLERFLADADGRFRAGLVATARPVSDLQPVKGAPGRARGDRCGRRSIGGASFPAARSLYFIVVPFACCAFFGRLTLRA
jgi:hypothetical protein